MICGRASFWRCIERFAVSLAEHSGRSPLLLWASVVDLFDTKYSRYIMEPAKPIAGRAARELGRVVASWTRVPLDHSHHISLLSPNYSPLFPDLLVGLVGFAKRYSLLTAGVWPARNA